MNSDDGGECNQTKKARITCQSNSDIISTLPRNILDNILICLPLQDAARTSILSTNWRFKWLYIPQLVFNYDNFFRNKTSKSSLEICFQIYQILLLHGGNLQKFVLSIPSKLKSESIINQIILFLTKKNIQELTLDSQYSLRKLPLTLWQCVQLTHLNLSSLRLTLPLSFEGLNGLVSVQLDWIIVDGGDLKTFISKCPLLQKLKLSNLKGVPSLEIDAPNLIFLYISCMHVSVIFNNVPLLSTFILKCSGALYERTSTIGNMFGSLSAIENLSADVYYILSMVSGVIPKRLPRMLRHLKCVKLSRLCFNVLEHVQCALLLINSSPNLQKLTIKVLCSEDVDDTLTLQLCEALNESECSFNRLQEVTFEKLQGTVAELELVKILLANSPMLRKITIHLSIRISAEKELKILKAVTRFQRASTKAEVIFEET